MPTGIQNPDPLPSNVRPDEGKGVKRKNDDSAALLPTEETQESTNNQEERQQVGDEQMQDAAVDLPNKSTATKPK